MPWYDKYKQELPEFESGGSFSEAFKKARKEKGENKEFVWNGNKYNTNFQEEDPVFLKKKSDKEYGDIATNRLEHYKNIENSRQKLKYSMPTLPNDFPKQSNPEINQVLNNKKQYEQRDLSNPLLKNQTFDEFNKMNNRYVRNDVLTNAQEKQTGLSKAWEVAKHPATAMTYLGQNQNIPDYFSKGETNPFDIALGLPAQGVQAVKNTVKNVFTPSVYSDFAKGTVAAAAYGLGEQVPESYENSIYNSLGVVGDALMFNPVLKTANKLTRLSGQIQRDLKYVTPFKTKGLNIQDQYFSNSSDWMEWYKKTGNNRPLLKKEINFLNKEIKDRGILEVQRANPLNPLPHLSKKGIVPEDSNIKQVINDFLPNLKEKSLLNQFTMGPGRVDAWNQYLGQPTTNKSYRVHPLSFQEGRGLTYTIPDKHLNQNWSKEALAETPLVDGMYSPLDAKRFSFLDAIRKNGINKKLQDQGEVVDWDNFNTETLKTLKQNGWTERELRKQGVMQNKKFNADLNDEDITNIAISKNNPNILYDADLYHGSGGGVRWETTPLKNGATEWAMKDKWDINPFSRFKTYSDIPLPKKIKSKIPKEILEKNLPDFVKRLDAAPLLGGKNFDVEVNYHVSPKYNSVINKYDSYQNGGQINNWTDKYKN